MLIKFFKTIHNKYARFFKFIFFLRYLFVIFIVSISLFLIIPKFFNYEKKEQIIKNYLKENYNFEIGEHENISYKAFPTPKLEFKKVKLKFLKSNTNLSIKSLEIYPKAFGIYNLNYFETRKIILNDNTTNLEITNLPIFIDQLINQKKKISLNNLNIQIVNENNLIAKLENILFTNFGYKKNSIEGKVFGKKFKIDLDGNFEFVKFRLANSGIYAELNLDEKKKTGIFKSKILNTNLKFNFQYEKKNIKIFDTHFRSKNLSFSNESFVTVFPFLIVNTSFEIDELNFILFEKLNFIKLLDFKHIIKKINSNNVIIVKSNNFINDLKLEINSAYGRLNYKKKFLLSKNLFECEGSLNILEEYPLLYFNCSIMFNDKQKFFKKFSIKTKNNKDILRLKVNGNLNLLNKKINFKEISSNKKKSSNEDLKYFKNSFENILFNENIFKIFDKKKIKDFILEII